MLFGDEYYCGCIQDFTKRPSESSTYCEMHDPSKPWASILNTSQHYASFGQTNRRYVGGHLECQLHELFWIMGGVKPEGGISG